MEVLLSLKTEDYMILCTYKEAMFFIYIENVLNE